MVIRVTASFFVAFTGLFLVRTGNISGAQIGFILSFALNTSQGGSQSRLIEVPSLMSRSVRLVGTR